MKIAIRAIVAFLGGVLLVVAIGLAFVWPTVERSAAPWALARLFHASDVRVGGASETDGALVLDDVSLQNPDGTLVFAAKRARIAGGGLALFSALADPTKTVDVALAAPHLAIAQSAVDPASARALLDAVRSGGLGSRRIVLSVLDGSATVGDETEPAHALVLAHLHGRFDLTRETATYDVAGDELAGTPARRYPFVGSAVATVTAGEPPAIVHRWNAPSLALQPFSAIEPAAGIVVRGGFVRSLAVTVRDAGDAAPAIDASGTFAHVGGALEGDAAHDFSEAAGRFRVHGATLAVSTLVARLGRAKLDAFGEIRDLPASAAWLRGGTHELALAGRMLGAIASQPDLDAVDLEADAPGIVFAHYHLQNPLGPRAISLVGIDPRVPGVRLDTSLAEDRIVSGGERTSALAARTSAVAGINGDYFDIGRSYQPQGMLVSGGTLLRSPADRATLAIHRDGSVTFGEFRCSGSLTTPQSVLHVSEYNDWPAGYGTVVTPAFGKVLRYAPGETFVALDATGPRGRYRVASVTPSAGEIPVRFGVGFGALDDGVSLPRPGQLVKLDYGCSPSLADVVAVLGGGPQLLKDGEWYEDPHAPAPDERPVRWPVVALAHMRDGTLAMVAVDGRHPERALGMSRPEFADLLKSLGADGAMALDSGGSVTLVARRPGDKHPSVRNRPSDNDGERWISDGLFVYSSAPAPTMTEAPAVVPGAAESAAPAPASTTLETVVNPDLPGGVATSPSPAAT